MSLRDFLPVSSALRRADGDGGRFRPAEPGLLPDFSAGRGGAPGASGASSATLSVRRRVVGANTFSEDGPAAVVPGDSGRVEAGTAGTSAGVASAGRAGEVAARVSGAERRALRRLPGWLEQMLFALVRTGNRRRNLRPVQPELGLDSVKVARNDLTTADVEVVLVKSERRPARMSAECRGRLLRLWWEEGSRRLRRLGNTLW